MICMTGLEQTHPVEKEMPDWLRDALQPVPAGPPEPEAFDVEMFDQLVGDAVKELLSFSSERAIANVVENVNLQASVYHDVEDEAWVNLSMRGKTVFVRERRYHRKGAKRLGPLHRFEVLGQNVLVS